MSKEEIAKMKRKLRRLHKKLAEIGPVMRGKYSVNPFSWTKIIICQYVFCVEGFQDINDF